MVLITHDLGVVAGRTDDIAVMYAGRIVEQAPTEVLFAQMQHPYTEALMRSIPRIEDPSHTRLRVITGRPPDLIAPPPGCKFAPRCPYAQERCRHEEPTLIEVGARGHRLACHFPIGTPDSVAGLEANISAGLPQAVALLEGREDVALNELLAAETAADQADWSGGESTTDEELTSGTEPAREE
jgi:peptide/nickel transport system ATP-binding protein